jgi:hypothetical protein
MFVQRNQNAPLDGARANQRRETTKLRKAPKKDSAIALAEEDVIGERLASAVRGYVEQKKIPIEDLTGVLGVSRTTAFKLAGKAGGRNASKAKTRPNLWTLRQVVAATQVSADYLLGHDAPADRDAATETGWLAYHLHVALRARAPKDALLDRIGNISDRKDKVGWSKAVVDEMVGAWWGQERARLAQAYGDALDRLADRLDDDSREVSDVAVAALMRAQAVEHRQTSAIMRSATGTWREIMRLQSSALIAQVPLPTLKAQRANDKTPIAFFEAPFGALGGDYGVGVAWRASEKHDEAWFIDARTLKVRHRRTGRFLIPLTLAERLARPGRGN